MASEIRALEFDGRNLHHLAQHGLDANLIADVLAGAPIVAVNAPRGGRSGSHLLVGPSSAGRHWTIVIVEMDDKIGLWRPITGWPSTTKEILLWQAND